VSSEPQAPSPSETELLAAAQQGNSAAFDRLVAGHRRELYAHCYRLLGSVQDAEDALQEALLGAWKGLAPFQGRSSLRTWLYKVTTHACLRLLTQRPRRRLSPEYGPARSDTTDLGQPVLEPIWLEPWVEPGSEPASWSEDRAAPAPDPAGQVLQRESIELAFIAALQHLPGTQRAALLLSDVLEFSAAEIAGLLETSVAAVNSALQRARKTLGERASGPSQQVQLASLGQAGQDALVRDFVRAWESADLGALLQLLTEDARFVMPPLPAWFDGRENVARFFAERIFALRWRLLPLSVNGQLGFACYSAPPGAGELQLSAVNLLNLRDARIAEIVGFLDPAVYGHFGLPAVPSAKNHAPER
jgi:RNA polymerase sigma-70 factor (TIGR02960 family)